MESANSFNVGKHLRVAYLGDKDKKIVLYRQNIIVKVSKANDNVEKKLFVVDAINLGATKSLLAKGMGISRQTIDNYLDVYNYFGIEGLVHSYSPKKSKKIEIHRKENAQKLQTGNKTKIVHDHIKQEKMKQRQFILPIAEPDLEKEEQPYHKEHEWVATRYAGIFVYIITLIFQYDWVKLLQGYFGATYKLFLAFLLMVARNIKSVEQFKNVRLNEAAKLLGINELPSRNKIRSWMVLCAELEVSAHLLKYFFRQQIRAGIVASWLWFTDGHLLEYTGKEKLRPAYYTQRRLMVPGRTNLVTTDHTGRIVYFDIQEGKGNLKNHITVLDKKWRSEVPGGVIHVFDREGDGKDFFFNLNKLDIHFVTWEKNIDTAKLNALSPDVFTDEFQFNQKKYRFFEGKKEFTVTVDETDVPVSLRRIYIWNLKSNKRTCGLSNAPESKMSTKECVTAILSRWGASENTFKHLKQRHPLHNEPSYKMVESERQDMANPELKLKKGLLERVKSSLNSLYRKLSKTAQVLKKDGTPRKKCARSTIEQKIAQKEAEMQNIQKEISETPDRIDCSQHDAYKNFKHINTESKNLYDFVVTSVWNARKQMVEWLRPMYENKNEYVDLFYAITNCHGWIQSKSDQVTVRLEPLEQHARRAAQVQFCRKLTSLKARTPTGKLLRIEVGKSPL